MNKLLIKATTGPGFVPFAQACIGLAAVGLLCWFPPPPWFSRAFYLPGWQTLAALLIFFALLLRKKGNIWGAVQAVMVFSLFTLPLLYRWQTAYYDGNLIGGLLPWSDASAYLQEVYRLVNGALFTAWGGRRPLFASLLAVIIRLNGGEFMLALVILNLINSLAVLIALHAIKRWHGAVAASTYLLVTYEFYTLYAGKTLTEQLGFALGNLAVFFVLAGAQAKSFWRALFGLGLLTLALNARAGAFFILPALICWFVYYFRKQVVFWRTAGLATLLVLAVFGLNLLLARILTGQSGTTFSNYSYTLYGLASGNKGWNQVNKDYPGISEAEIMPLAIQKIRENPRLLLYGMKESVKDYFKVNRGAFSFVSMRQAQSEVNILLWEFVLLGLLWAFYKRKTGSGGLVLASFAGVFSSLSLLPPIDASLMRAFAATIPFSALWVAAGVAAGVSAISSWARPNIIQADLTPPEDERLPIQQLAVVFSSIMIVFCTLGPLALLVFPVKYQQPAASASTCQPDQEMLEAVVFNHASFTLIRDDAAKESYMPFIRISDFQGSMIKSGYPFLDEELLKMQPDTHLTYGLKFRNGTASLSTFMISNFPVKAGGLSMCAQATDNEKLARYRFYNLPGDSVPPSTLTFSQRFPNVTQTIRWLYAAGLGLLLLLLAIDLFAPFRRKPVMMGS